MSGLITDHRVSLGEWGPAIQSGFLSTLKFEDLGPFLKLKNTQINKTIATTFHQLF